MVYEKIAQSTNAQMLVYIDKKLDPKFSSVSR